VGSRRPPAAAWGPFWGGLAGAADLALLLVGGGPLRAPYGVGHLFLLVAAAGISFTAGRRARGLGHSALQSGALSLCGFAAVPGLALFLGRGTPLALRLAGFGTSLILAAVWGSLLGLAGGWSASRPPSAEPGPRSGP
jgi:hypothetical protein